MKIRRIINGKLEEIELTWEERVAAYQEQQNEFDRMDICNEIELYGEDLYGVHLRDFAGEEVSIMAGYMRKNIDKYDMSYDYARLCAVHDYMAERRVGNEV